MITRSSIAFEDFLGSSIAPQVMPPCLTLELFQVVLEVECPNAELDDQLCNTLNKGFEGGDVPHVVGALLHPLWVVN